MMVVTYLPMLFSLLAFSAYAGEGVDSGLALELEPCVNGAVSESGAYPSQEMEVQIEAYLAWSEVTGSPFYMFRASRNQLFGAYYDE